jgi:hypothetical protein
MTAMSVPDRSLQQRMEALQNANEIRTYRANLKRDIKAGRADVVNLLINPPDEIETMHIFDLMMAVPKLGRVKVNKVLSKCRISPSKTVGGMSERQRNELVLLLGRR